MILYSEHKEVKEPVGYVCDVCGKRSQLANTYDRLYRNTVEDQMGVVRVLQPDGTADLGEVHVCCWKCAVKAAGRYNMRMEIRIPAFGVFDKGHAADLPESDKTEKAEETLSELCFRGVEKDERYRQIGERICRYIQCAGADPVKLITLAAAVLAIDKDIERTGGCDDGNKKM